jgi:hypothetical protein
MIPKRYPETLKIAAMSEINRMLTRSGVSGQVQSLLSHGKKFVSCMKSCMVRFPLLNTLISQLPGQTLWWMRETSRLWIGPSPRLSYGSKRKELCN